ncbi:putative tetratricopeptide repeat protein [Operophtera brumata]|uniref:Putative tetratricopeptide repeat protein n=1 Tax=Operophtera brumata TaxID=104452 RepID=A0A0L7L0F3_OPEBR|nr:putative tetratricopeptide repeat protein [Operophtera brumata]
MEDVLDEVVSSEDLQKFERVFHEQLHQGNVSHKAQFEYAWCLGILLLKELFNSHPEGKRDYLFYLAIGNARIKEYNKALHYRQINKRMEKEGLIGMAVAGGAVLALGGIVGLGIALASKK